MYFPFGISLKIGNSKRLEPFSGSWAGISLCFFGRTWRTGFAFWGMFRHELRCSSTVAFAFFGLCAWKGGSVGFGIS